MAGGFTVQAFIGAIVMLFSAIMWIYWIVSGVVKRKMMVEAIEKIPGPPAKPIIGNLKGLRLNHDTIFINTLGMILTWSKHGAMRIWAGMNPLVFLCSPEVIEPIVTSNVNLDKSREYESLLPWLGDGILTVKGGPKWFSRRKMLTPAFHFSILEDFLSVMNEQSQTLVRILKELPGKENFDLFPYINRCALDIICESAMGCPVNAQVNQNSAYNQALIGMSDVIQTKFHCPWLQIPFIFKMSQHHRTQNSALDVLKGFTKKVIKEKKAEMKNSSLKEQQEKLGKKKRLAFLDLVLTSKTQDGKSLTNQELQEEVDTFMFAGHDTITAAMTWLIFLLGHNPKAQEKCYEEVREIFGDDFDRPVTSDDLRKLKYLECCMKESQRLYPSVPYWGRTLKEDLKVNGYHLPAGTTAMVCTFILHRNPDIFPDPEKFDPDRFTTENAAGRHPYAYIPFSAGPRNCLGQKFALTEEKVVMSHLLRNFKFESVETRDEVVLVQQLILKPRDGLLVRMTPRKSH